MRLLPNIRWSALRPRLATLRATIRLLYLSHPRAFVVSAVASLGEPLFYPAFIVLLQRTLQSIVEPAGSVQFTPEVTGFGFGLVALILLQRLGIIVRDGASTILRQEAWVVISKRIMQKLPAVPYPLFENNAFQARYGLVIREASYRSITLVDSLLSTAPVLFGMLGLAVTLFVLAPWLVLAMVAISIPAGLIEQKFSGAMYALQEHSAPDKHWPGTPASSGRSILRMGHTRAPNTYSISNRRRTLSALSRH